MKKAILFTTILVSTIFGHQINAQEVFDGPAISVDKETHDYGFMAFEANGACEFTITNTGTEPLLITGARGSCGCTVPTYPQEPIAPGKSAVIKVTYNTSLIGDFNKSVTITSNAVNEPTKVVFIKGNVAPRPEGTAADAPANGSATLTIPKN
jgi:hypothetical protein